MQNYKELLERFEQEVLNGMTNSASHQARVIFVEWLEKQAVEQPLAPDVCPVCLGKKLVQTKSRGIINCASCNGTGQRR